MAKASIAIESNHLTEAILSYISVIAIYEESLSPASKEFADSAATELARIGRSLTIEPGSEWIDAKGGQIAASSRSVGKEGALSPSVYLYENYGSGKSPVADASIYFEFTKNSGSIISLVNTDVYGKANTNISRLDNPGKEAMIRAYPRFQARGKVFSFKSVAREFSYLPPTNVARIMVLETSEFGASDNPQTVDAIVGTLKPIGLQFVPFNGKLAMEDFKKAFGGDHAILAALGVDASAPYTVFALVEAAAARQMELDGKKYNIFTSQAQATFRLMRADGTVAFAIPINGERGQGGTPEAAAADAIKKARDALVVMMKERLGLIKDALEKE